MQASEVKAWAFATITDNQGITADVEFPGADVTKNASAIAESINFLKGTIIHNEGMVESSLGIDRTKINNDWNLRIAVGTLRTAISELQCQYAGVGMTQALGGKQQERIPLYANINRYLNHIVKKRKPNDFAQAANRAIMAGFTHLKTDPFDEISQATTPRDARNFVSNGYERISAMKSAGGAQISILVDCHGAFDVETASIVGKELAKLGVIFFEDPVRIPPVNHLAEVAKSVNIPVVAGGSSYGEDSFENLVENGKVSIIMPDVQRCGGIAVAARAARTAANSNVKTSCHSPFGPLSLLASAHVQASTPQSFPLEHAVFENNWRAELVEPKEQVQDGCLVFPGGIGLGAALNWEVLERHGQIWCI